MAIMSHRVLKCMSFPGMLFHTRSHGDHSPLSAKLPIGREGFYSLRGKASYRQVSWSLESARFDVREWSYCFEILTGIPAALLQRCVSNVRAIGRVQTRISQLRDFTISCGKTSIRLVNRGPDPYSCCWTLTQYFSGFFAEFSFLFLAFPQIGASLNWNSIFGCKSKINYFLVNWNRGFRCKLKFVIRYCFGKHTFGMMLDSCVHWLV